MKINKNAPLLLFLAVLLCNQVMAQQKRFPIYIGMYCYDRDGGIDDAVPPSEQVGLDDAYLAELTKYNFNLILSTDPARQPVTSSSAPPRFFLDRVQNAGLKIIVGNTNFQVDRNNPVYSPADVALGLGHYNSHPAVIGYDISDEPCMTAANVIGQVSDQIIAYDNTKIPFVNLWPNWAPNNRIDDCDTTTEFAGDYSTYVQRFIDYGHAKMLAFDFYPLGADPAECGWQRHYYVNLDIVGKKAAINNIPFYLVVNTYQLDSKFPVSCDPKISSLNNLHGMDNISYLRYSIFSGMMYGAKGLLYWPREIAVPNYNLPTQFIFPFDVDMSVTTKQELGTINKKLLDHSYELGGLKFESSYHVTELLQVAILNSAWIGQLYDPHMQWNQFASDAATVATFNTSNPITPAPTFDVHNPNGSDFLAFSYLSDAGGKKYMWVMNKDYHATAPASFTLNFNGQKTVVDILEDQICTNVNSISVELEPGEGKLFLIDNYYYQNMTITSAFPSLNITITADNLTLSGNQITGASVDRFYAKHITVTPGAYFQAGTDVLLKAETSYCGVFRAPAVTDSQHEPAPPAMQVMPNPNNGHFTVKIEGDAEKQFDFSVETVLGQVVYRSRITGRSQAEIDLSSLPDGMYLIKLSANGDVVKTVKAIVNH